MAGFFTPEKKKTTKSQVSNTRRVGCNTCGRCTNSSFGKIGVYGKGKRKILVIHDSPTKRETTNQQPFSSPDRQHFKEMCREMGVDFFGDFFHVYAVRGHNDEQISTTNINACRNLLLGDIKELQPEKIIVLGKVALQTLYGDRCSARVSTANYDAWYGWSIPDQKLGCMVYPILDPSEVTFPLKIKKSRMKESGNFTDERGYLWEHSKLRKNDDFILRCKFQRRYLTKALSSEKFVRNTYEEDVEVILDEDKAIEALQYFNTSELISWDYETTGLKPHKKGHRILCVGISDGKRNVAFPMFMNNRRFVTAMRVLLTNPDVKKISHNYKFEEKWTRVILGYETQGMYWDSMLAAHCIDNRPGITGLKLQTFVRLGIIGYDDAIDHYIGGDDDKDGNSFNRLDKVDMEDLCLYCAKDAYFTYLITLQQEKEMDARPELYEGYCLFMDATLAFVDMEENGLKLDPIRVMNNEIELKKLVQEAEHNMMNTEAMKLWEERERKTFNPNSNKHMVKLIYDILGHPVTKRTDTGNPSVDDEALGNIDDPFCKFYTRKQYYEKLLNYIKGFKREAVDGYVHGNFNLNNVVSFRSSCVAKGTKIMVPEKFLEYPEGVPIENIQEGDYVYTYDDDLNLTINRVKWTGKTGHKKVIRVYWHGGTGRYRRDGYIDLTPEHLVRLETGEYVRADQLLDYDTRDKTHPNWWKKRKTTVLSLRRACGNDDRIYPTNKDSIPEHVFIYEYFSGEKVDSSKYHIHHKDWNHENHDFSNLEKLTAEEHTSLHSSILMSSDKRKREISEHSKRLWAEGKMDASIRYGEDCHNYIGFTEKEIYSLLDEYKGRVKNIPHDFGTIVKYCNMYNIDYRKYKKFFSASGEKLTDIKVFETLKEYGWAEALNILRIGHKKLEWLCEEFGIRYTRAWGNQMDYYYPHTVTMNNHYISRIEYLEEPVDVYDMEVENTHNFIANEICVHNCSGPNLQNLPSHNVLGKDKTMGNFVAHKDNEIIVGVDGKSLEVQMGVNYHKDQTLLKYTLENFDMHKALTDKIFMTDIDAVAPVIFDMEQKRLTNGEIPKEEQKWPSVDKAREELRHIGKNGASFSLQFGSHYVQIAETIWEKHLLYEHKQFLLSKGISTLKEFNKHIEGIFHWYWEETFSDFHKWRQDTWKKYIEDMELFSKTGFLYSGIYRRNQILNYPIQGSGFVYILRGIVNINNYIREHNLQDKVRIISQIHDALYFSVDKDFWFEEFQYVVNELMDDKVKEYYTWVIAPMGIDCTIYEGDWSHKNKDLSGDIPPRPQKNSA